MFYPIIRLSILLVLILFLSTAAYSKIASKDTNNHSNTIGNSIKKKQLMLLKTKKSNIIQYTSLYDEIAELTISKNQSLVDMDRADDIDTDKICNFILEYEEVEFIKTQYYKTPFHDDVSKTLENVASLYELCHPPMAGKYLKSVLKIKQNVYGKESVETANAYDALGDHYRFNMAEFKNAIEHYEKAKDIREKLYGVDDPRSTENYTKLAMSMYYHGDKKNRAEKLLFHSIDIRKKASLSKDLPLYVAYMNLGIYYSMKDESSKSIVYLQKALKAFEGKVNSNYIVIISELSQLYLNKKDIHNALKFAEEAYHVSKEFYKDGHHQKIVESLRQVNEISRMIRKR